MQVKGLEGGEDGPVAAYHKFSPRTPGRTRRDRLEDTVTSVRSAYDIARPSFRFKVKSTRYFSRSGKGGENIFSREKRNRCKKSHSAKFETANTQTAGLSVSRTLRESEVNGIRCSRLEEVVFAAPFPSSSRRTSRG